MMPNNDANNILEAALAAFREQTGLAAQAVTTPQGGDGIEIPLATGSPRFAAIVLPRLTETDLALATPAWTAPPPILLTRYVPTAQADRLKERGIFFLDTAGNGYVNAPPLFFFVKGNRPAQRLPAATPRRAFHTAGLKVIYPLLTQPGLEKRAYREIAATAQVALGTVNRVLGDLNGQGYFDDHGKRGRGLRNRVELLRRWLTGYPEQLRPKLLLGRFRAPDTNWWRQVDIKRYDALWGGEVAAARMTEHLKPTRVTLYAAKLPEGLLLDHRLRRDNQGDIEILQRFWPAADTDQAETVHPLLVYADLLASGDDRNREIAELIWERDLARLVAED